jgi:glycine C-acetyltransferase
MASVRFICGTQDLHKQLEDRIAEFFGTEDTILYAACFDANGGLFEPLLGEQDAIISDALNHASIIDGVRLCKASATATPTATWPTWKRSSSRPPTAPRTILITSDGVFSMDGSIATAGRDHGSAGEEVRRAGAHRRMPCHRLPRRQRSRLRRVAWRDGQIDIFTGTLGKALGGALGGFTTGAQGDHRTAAPALAPLPVLQLAAAAVVAAGIKVFEMLSRGELRDACARNARYFRERMSAAGFDLKPGVHPISAR